MLSHTFHISPRSSNIIKHINNVSLVHKNYSSDFNGFLLISRKISNRGAKDRPENRLFIHKYLSLSIAHCFTTFDIRAHLFKIFDDNIGEQRSLQLRNRSHLQFEISTRALIIADRGIDVVGERELLKSIYHRIAMIIKVSTTARHKIIIYMITTY